MKKCNKCGEIKELDDFYKRKKGKDGFLSQCRECVKEKVNKYRIANLDKIKDRKRVYRETYPEKIKESRKKHYEANSERINKANKKWKEAHPEKAREAVRNWKKNNPEKKAELNKKWAEANPEKRRESKEKWVKNNPEKRKEASRKYSKSNPDKMRERMRLIRKTPKGNLDGRMSNAINQALKGNKKGRKWEDLVGYTVSDLKNHVEKLFTYGMTWNLFLKGKIHLDHIIPKSVFNYTLTEHIDFKRCWALDNLQPLWATDNVKKHAKLERPFQPYLQLL